ncbi:MAG: C40 family peptidase [Myxococcota bacterium]|nr:C40 family peptidase [Myxococcota bacterium]
MQRLLRLAVALASLSLALACSGPRGPEGPSSRSGGFARSAAARTAEAMIGAPYRYRGSTPKGFDCSGLVVYSYAEAGVSGLPRSAASLERVARPVSLTELEPGDLLFFQLSGKKTSHVALYVGDRAFVHAPSSGKRVERVSFDHVYWAPRIDRAGRLEY